MTKSASPVPGTSPELIDVATLLALDIPADCRAGLLANFDLFRSHAERLDAGIKAARNRTSRKTAHKVSGK